MNNYSCDENLQKILSKAEDKNIEIEVAEDFLIGDINDPYCHTHIVELVDMTEEEELGIVDVGPRSSQRLIEILNDFQKVILYGETGNSWCHSGRDCTKELLNEVKESEKLLICVGGGIENFAKNVIEIVDEEDEGDFRISFVGEDFLKRYSHLPVLKDLESLFLLGKNPEEDESKKVNELELTSNESEEKSKAEKKGNKNPVVSKEGRKNSYDIFVGGLPSDTTKETLSDYFSQFGKISKCTPQFWGKKSSKNRKCKGFGIISCKDEKTYEMILQQKLHKFRDRKIECKPKLKKTKLAKYSKNLLKRKIFISGLPSYVTSEKLETILSENIGEIEIAYVIKHRKSKKSRGFGFVVFKDHKDREKLLEMGHFQIKDRTIKCSAYEPKAKGEAQKPEPSDKSQPEKVNGDEKILNKNDQLSQSKNDPSESNFENSNLEEKGGNSISQKIAQYSLFRKLLKKKKIGKKVNYLNIKQIGEMAEANGNALLAPQKNIDHQETFPPKYKEPSKQQSTSLNGYSYFGGYKI